MGYRESAREFVADADRTRWHDQAVWFVRSKRDQAVDLVPGRYVAECGKWSQTKGWMVKARSAPFVVESGKTAEIVVRP